MHVNSVVKTPSTDQQCDNKSELQKVLPQILAVMVKNLVLLAFGMSSGFTVILIPSLSKRTSDNEIYLTEEEISWVGSIAFLCVPIGCLLSGIITQPIGRRRSMQCVTVPLILCWLGYRYCDSVWQIYLAQSVIGLSGGLVEVPIYTYVAEITQPHVRGILSTTGAFAGIGGGLIVLILGTCLHWRTVAVYSIIVPLLSFVLLFFVPESPHWYIAKNRMNDARKSLAWLRGWTTTSAIEEELQLLSVQEKDKEMVSGNYLKSSVKLYTKRRFLCPFALSIFVYFLGNFTGTVGLATYAVLILSTLKVPMDSYVAAVLLATAQLIGTILCLAFIRYIGKRGITFASLFLIGVCFTIVATYAYLIDAKYLIASTSKSSGMSDIDASQWVPLIALAVASLAGAGGIKILPAILIGEIFSEETRSIGCGVVCAIGYVFAFIANKIFLQMVSTFTLYGTYWFFGFMGILGMIVLYFWLPETEGKDLQEISDHFAGKTNIGNKVKRKRKSNLYGNENEGLEHEVPTIGNVNRV